jgi:hypothetical protein
LLGKIKQRIPLYSTPLVNLSSAWWSMDGDLLARRPFYSDGLVMQQAELIAAERAA